MQFAQQFSEPTFTPPTSMTVRRWSLPLAQISRSAHVGHQLAVAGEEGFRGAASGSGVIDDVAVAVVIAWQISGADA